MTARNSANLQAALERILGDKIKRLGQHQG